MASGRLKSGSLGRPLAGGGAACGAWIRPLAGGEASRDAGCFPIGGGFVAGFAAWEPMHAEVRPRVGEAALRTPLRPHSQLELRRPSHGLVHQQNPW